MIKEVNVLKFKRLYSDYYDVVFSINGHERNKVMKIPRVNNISKSDLTLRISNMLEREKKIIKESLYKKNNINF